MVGRSQPDSRNQDRGDGFDLNQLYRLQPEMKTNKFEVIQPTNVKLWDRIRIYVNLDDYRSVVWPPIGPYWCSGSTEHHSIVIAYVPSRASDKEIRRQWPEVESIDRIEINMPQILYSDRFPKPDWWILPKVKSTST